MAVRFRRTGLATGARHRRWNGEVYEPQLEALLQNRKDKQCTFRVTDAALARTETS